MKLGPFTFQCACLHWVCRSIASESRRLSSAATCERVDSRRSLRVGYSLRPDLGGDLVRVAMVDLLEWAGGSGTIRPARYPPKARRSRPRRVAPDGASVRGRALLRALRVPRRFDMRW